MDSLHIIYATFGFICFISLTLGFRMTIPYLYPNVFLGARPHDRKVYVRPSPSMWVVVWWTGTRYADYRICKSDNSESIQFTSRRWPFSNKETWSYRIYFRSEIAYRLNELKPEEPAVKCRLPKAEAKIYNQAQYIVRQYCLTHPREENPFVWLRQARKAA